MLDLICGMCGQPIRVPERALGHRARCRGCGMEFVVPPRAESGPVVVKPAGEPEFTSQRSARQSVDLSLTPEDAPTGAAEPEDVPVLRPIGPTADAQQTQEQLDAEFLDELEAERRRHITTGKFSPHRRRTASQRQSRLLLAVFGGVTVVAALAVLLWFAIAAGGRKPTTPPQQPDMSRFPSRPRPGSDPGQPASPRPRPPVQPVETDAPEARLRLLGPPEFSVDKASNSALASGWVINDHAGLVEEAVVTVAIYTDDGAFIGRFSDRAAMVPPRGGKAPFTIDIGEANDGRLRRVTMSDYTVVGRPDPRSDWVELTAMAGQRLDEQAHRAVGDVENRWPFRVGHIRVMCDLYSADGRIVLQKMAVLRDPNVMLRARSYPHDFTLTWTAEDIRDTPLLDQKMTCRAVGRKLDD